mgnify:CR=1 FL=1
MKNFITFAQLDASLMHRAGLNENDIDLGLRQLYINDKLMKVYRVLDGMNDPWYDTLLNISPSADLLYLSDIEIHGGEIYGLNTTTNTLSLSTSSVPIGSLLFVTHVNNSTGTVIKGQFTAKVTVAGGAGIGNPITYQVISGTEGPSYNDDLSEALFITILKSYSGSSIDLSALYVKNIKKIYDNGYTASKSRIFKEIEDTKAFEMLHRDPFYASRVCYHHAGDTVFFFVGSLAAAISSTYMEYRRKPAIFTDSTLSSVIDIPPEDNQILFDECLALYLGHAGKEVPQDVLQRNQYFADVYQAAVADESKTKSKVTHRG